MVLLREKPKSNGVENGWNKPVKNGTGCLTLVRAQQPFPLSSLTMTRTRTRVFTKMEMERDQNHNHIPKGKNKAQASKCQADNAGIKNQAPRTPLHLKETQASLNRKRGVLQRQDALVMKSSKESLSSGCSTAPAKTRGAVKSPSFDTKNASESRNKEIKEGGGRAINNALKAVINSPSPRIQRNVPLSLEKPKSVAVKIRAGTEMREQERSGRNQRLLSDSAPLSTSVRRKKEKEAGTGQNRTLPNTLTAAIQEPRKVVKVQMREELPTPPLEFVVPLEENIEIVEGSELELWVKLKGAVSVVWVKGEKVLPHFPPYFLHSVNPAQGIYSLKIRDVFLQDEGLYECKAQGRREELGCRTRVKVIEETEAETESTFSSGSASEPVLPPPASSSALKRGLVIPEIKIIEDMEEPSRGELRRSSGGSSFEEPLEDIHEEDEEEVAIEAEKTQPIIPIPSEKDLTLTLTSSLSHEERSEVIKAVKAQPFIPPEDPAEPPEQEWTDVPLKKSDPFNTYEKHEQLGKGRFGIVFKLKSHKTGAIFAGKFVKCRKAADKERALLEYKIMNHLQKHEQLLTLTDAFEQQREVVLVTDLIPGGELFELVVSDAFTLTEQDCVSFLRQICAGVAYIHSQLVIHLDLKPENILCTFHPQSTAPLSATKIKIIDFGLAQFYSPTVELRVLFGTPEFVAPEVIAYEPISPATDMWSVGVITYILLSGLSPFLGDSDPETFNNITEAELVFEDEVFDSISPLAKDFISSLIVKRKETRLTAETCLLHPWLLGRPEAQEEVPLRTDKLKRFLLRRKWQKTGNAIRALGRITTLYSRRSSSEKEKSSTGGSFGAGFGKSLSQEEGEEEVFSEGRGNGSNSNSNKQYLDESCRSDSGIGGENYSSLEQTGD